VATRFPWPGAPARSGTSAREPRPGALGIDGDFYLRSSNGDVYTKAAGSWSVTANILGPVGPAGPTGGAGPTGPAGANGSLTSQFNHFADAGNTTTGETDLYSDTIAAGKLAANGDKLWAWYGGITVSHATNTRRIRAYFAGTVVYDSTAVATPSAAPVWRLEIWVERVSASVVRVIAEMRVTGEVFARTQYTEITGLTLANTQILKITGQSSSSTNDIVAKMSNVSYIVA
jgi:hypothetical protein